MKFTNYTAGPKGVHTKSGLVYVEAGKTSEDLDVSEAEAKAAKATGWFSRAKVEDDDDADDDKPLGELTVAKLRALAEAEEIDLGDATKKDDIVAAIELAREAKAA